MIFDIFLTENNNKSSEKSSAEIKQGLGFRFIKSYVRFFHDKLYYRKVHTINAENIPENCPLMIVSNHQNCMCDPLAILMSMHTRQERKTKIIARANIFQNSFANRALRYLGLIPVFRLERDGADNLVHNEETFKEVEDELLNDGTVIIFPEGKHQNKRWLGKFSYGYLHILFKAAEKSNFEKEMFILPSCNHYSNYFGIQEDILVKYGTPISLAPYYELYKTKPRTAQRKVNALVREQVKELMLNIEDIENYESIDYLRETYGVEYTVKNGLNPNNLHEKLISDKQLCTKLYELKLEKNDEIQSIYKNSDALQKTVNRLKITDSNFDNKSSNMKILMEGLLFLLFLPLYIISLVPNVLIMYPPKVINSKIEDKMMHNTIMLIVSLVFSIPVLYILIFVLVWLIRDSFITALIYLICLPFLGIFAWNYNKSWKIWKKQIRFNKLSKSGKLDDIISLRNHIHKSLDNLLK